MSHITPCSEPGDCKDPLAFSFPIAAREVCCAGWMARVGGLGEFLH